MTRNLLDFFLLRQVIFSGFMTVENLIAFESSSCNKEFQYHWKNIMYNGNQLGVKYFKQLVFNFGNFNARHNAEVLDDWLKRHRAFKVQDIYINNYNDASCKLGIDLLSSQKPERLSISQSFYYDSIINVSRFTQFLQSCASTLVELNFSVVNTITATMLSELQGLDNCKVLSILECPKVQFVELFSLLDRCTTLETFRFMSPRRVEDIYFSNRKDYCHHGIYYDQFKHVFEVNKLLQTVCLTDDIQAKCDIKRIMSELFTEEQRSVSFKKRSMFYFNGLISDNENQYSDVVFEDEEDLDDDRAFGF